MIHIFIKRWVSNGNYSVRISSKNLRTHHMTSKKTSTTITDITQHTTFNLDLQDYLFLTCQLNWHYPPCVSCVTTRSWPISPSGTVHHPVQQSLMPRLGVTSSYITSSLSFFNTSHYSNHYHHTTHNHHNHSHSHVPFNNLTSSRCFPTHQQLNLIVHLINTIINNI